MAYDLILNISEVSLLISLILLVLKIKFDNEKIISQLQERIDRLYEIVIDFFERKSK